MRVGQHVLWKSAVPESTREFSGTVRAYEHDRTGKAVVSPDCTPDRWIPIARSRLIIPQPPAKFSAKGGGDSPTSTAALLEHVA